MPSPIKTIGILGGMGPEATAFFYQKIVKFTSAKKDQEHIPTLIYSNPKIPSRTMSILQQKHKEVIKELQRSAKIIESAGADFIVIPCNTVHYYLKEIQESVKIPVLNMIEETAEYIHKKYKKENKMGLLATKGTIISQIYPQEFEKLGIKVIVPKEKTQNEVMGAIEDIKAQGCSKRVKRIIKKAIKELRMEKKIEIIILGCTELPLLFQKEKPLGIIDPMNILAKKAIQRAGGKIHDNHTSTSNS